MVKGITARQQKEKGLMSLKRGIFKTNFKAAHPRMTFSDTEKSHYQQGKRP
jgi:hypothetical protein